MDALQPKSTLSILLDGWVVPGLGSCWVVTQVPIPLLSLLSQIRNALDAKIYYAALSVTFSLPDVCASLEADADKACWATAEKYVAWFDRNVTDRFKSIDGRDFYCMRGGVSHRGQFSHSKSKFDRVVFLLPGSPFKSHDCVVTFQDNVTLGGISAEEILNDMPDRAYTGRLLFMEVVPFCRTVMDAVEVWAVSKASDANVQINVKRLAHYRPEGFPPLMVGFPVIA